MSAWIYARRLFSLDTLDTRFVASSSSPPRSSGVVETNGKENRDAIAKSRPAKWNTIEYYVYYLVVGISVPLMCYTPYTVSKETHPEYPRFASLLSDGWIPGRRVDNSDQQYAGFRNNIPAMALVVIVHPILRIIFDKVYVALVPSNTASDSAKVEERGKIRASYDICFAAIFLFVLHGFSAFKVLLLLGMNFSIAKGLPRPWIPAATWIFNIGILFANELCHGYSYRSIAEFIIPAPFDAAEIGWGSWLDSYGGLIPRWEILFNITVLRLISFNLDYYWALDSRSASSQVEKKQLNPALLSERDRITIPAKIDRYNLFYYTSYVLYSPLYLAGPILTFNDYFTQIHHRAPSITFQRTALYAIRFLLALLTMEVLLHYIYAVAISKSNPAWSHYTPFQLSMLGFFNLHIIWLKLLLPWRFFRMWALLDGIDPPENMVRCMSNNYSALAFWRGWHRSFNRWIIRYLYVPLGGSGRGSTVARSVFNMSVVFMFVALWHDINARLLAWSWLIVLFLLPEILCSTVFFPAKNYRDRPDTYRILSGVGAVGNIFMMMAANLVGFALGLDGLEQMLSGIISGWHGWMFLVVAGGVLFTGVMVMFEIRESEKRRGIDLKC